MAIAKAPRSRLAAFLAVKSIDDVAVFLGVTRKALNFNVFAATRPAYRRFNVPKASGGYREISAPPPVIYDFQKQLLACLSAVAVPKRGCFGFVAGQSIVTNAKQHVDMAAVVNIDLRDFFSTIHFGRVRGVFENHPFNFERPVATVLAQICSSDKRLPQGGVTSPALSNLVCRMLDVELFRLGKEHRCAYSRYADDITFSTKGAMPTAIFDPARTPPIGAALHAIIKRHGFEIQERKLRLATAGMRKEATGLIVNQKVNVPRKYIRQTRAIIHSCATVGISAADLKFSVAHSTPRSGRPPSVIDHVRGRLDFIRNVRGKDDALAIKYAIAFERSVGVGIGKTVSVFGSAARKLSLLEEAVWVLVGYDASNNVEAQGTAFALIGRGFVTAAHTIAVSAAKRVVRWELLHASRPMERIPVTAAREHSHFDLAILETARASLACLRPSIVRPSPGSAAAVAGFPQWNSPADRLTYLPCVLVQCRAVSGRSCYLTNASVRGGNSGGPLLDDAGDVVGVVLQDSRGAFAPDGGVSIEHLDALSGVPSRDL